MLVLRLDLPNSVIILLTGPSSALKSGTAMERRSRFSECRRHEWGGGVWGGGGGVREVDHPSC